MPSFGNDGVVEDDSGDEEKGEVESQDEQVNPGRVPAFEDTGMTPTRALRSFTND